IGQCHLSRRPIEQTSPQSILESPHLTAHERLRDAKLRRRGRKAARLDNPREQLQLRQIRHRWNGGTALSGRRQPFPSIGRTSRSPPMPPSALGGVEIVWLIP